MKITLERFKFTDKSIIGKVYTDFNDFSCFSLENPKIGSEAQKDLAIPYGTYSLKRHPGSSFEKTLRSITNDNLMEMILVYNEQVSSGRGILIHWGNTEVNTKGCILLGNSIKENFLEDSRSACKDFYKSLKNLDLSKIKLEIIKKS